MWTTVQPEPPRRTQKPPRCRGRLGRFCRGYLMCVGGLTTAYVVIKLLVLLFVEIGKWLPSQPLL